MTQVWNYSFTVPCALIMLTLVIFYFSRPHLPIRRSRTFLSLLILQLLVMVFDVASSLADEHYSQVPDAALYFLNTAFFVLFLARIFWFFLFTAVIVRMHSRRFLLVAAIPLVAAVVIALSSPLSGAVFYLEDGAYRSGPFYYILYVCFFFYIALSMGLAAVLRNRMRKTEFAGAILYNLVLIAGNIVRFTFPYLLAMNTFCVVAILIIFLEFLNPDLYLTNRSPAFNMRGFRLVLEDMAGRKDYQMLGFVLKNYYYERSILGASQMDQVFAQVVRHLSETHPDMLLFYLRSGRFVLLRSGTTDWVAIREQIRDRFSKSWQTGQIDLSLNIGFTFAAVKSEIKDPESILTDFLVGLDEARETAEYGALDQEALPDAETVSLHVDTLRSLERALNQNEVEVFFQPLVDAETHELVAAEALARIRDASGKIIEPGMFIALAEKSGHINLLGEQVLEKTCAFINSHDMETLGLRWINVNLSPIQCMQRDTAERIAAILERHKVPVQRIHLELTEESMINYELLERQLFELKRRGFELVLDDYGSGYSNLTRVKHYPFNNIKIDMEVVWDYSRDHDEILPAIVHGFKQMGYSVTAEGVETEAMAKSLADIGVNNLQGFYFSKPLPPAEFVERYGTQ